MSNPNPGFTAESWALYGVGAVCCLLRLAGRIRRLGIRHLQADDYLVVFGLAWYTVLCVAFNQMLTGAGSNLMTDDDIAALTPQTKEERIRGSKWVFVSEHAMLLTIWSMKASMLVFYSRLIEGLPRMRKWLNLVIIWVVCGFIADELALWLICRPLSDYWAVPVDNIQCANYQYYQIVNAIFNISTDILILAIGIPPVLSARLSIQQKLILGFIFGLGAFVIVAAMLRGIYCLVPSLISYIYMNWYFREASVAVYVTNLPAIWAYWREVFPSLRRFTTRLSGTIWHSALSSHNNNHNHHPDKQYDSGATAGSGNHNHHHHHHHHHDVLDSKHHDVDLDTYPISKSIITTAAGADLEQGGMHSDDASSDSSISHGIGLNGIRRDITFTVEHLPKES